MFKKVCSVLVAVCLVAAMALCVGASVSNHVERSEISMCDDDYGIDLQ